MKNLTYNVIKKDDNGLWGNLDSYEPAVKTVMDDYISSFTCKESVTVITVSLEADDTVSSVEGFVMMLVNNPNWDILVIKLDLIPEHCNVEILLQPLTEIEIFIEPTLVYEDYVVLFRDDEPKDVDAPVESTDDDDTPHYFNIRFKLNNVDEDVLTRFVEATHVEFRGMEDYINSNVLLNSSLVTTDSENEDETMLFVDVNNLKSKVEIWAIILKVLLMFYSDIFLIK